MWFILGVLTFTVFCGFFRAEIVVTTVIIWNPYVVDVVLPKIKKKFRIKDNSLARLKCNAGLKEGSNVSGGSRFVGG